MKGINYIIEKKKNRSLKTKNVDETTIYDLSLINGLKTKFKEWKSGWKEQYLHSGDEFDEEKGRSLSTSNNSNVA